jgi:hypothetical protein
MKRVASISEVVDAWAEEGTDLEACATAEAAYDESGSQLVVELDSFLRRAGLKAPEKHFVRGWLPRAETVRTGVPVEEALPEAKAVFQSWVRRVRQAAATAPGRNRGR